MFVKRLKDFFFLYENAIEKKANRTVVLSVY